MSTSVASSSRSQTVLSEPSCFQDGIEHSPAPASAVSPSFSAVPTSSAPFTWHTVKSQGKLNHNDFSSLKSDKVQSAVADDSELNAQTSARLSNRLAFDQSTVLNPDADTPFSDQLDVVNRLLPYHILQQPKEDLIPSKLRKGKEKADNCDSDELAETSFAVDCFRRRDALRTRFRKVKVNSAKRASPDDQAYFLAQAVLEGDRSENAWLNNELRNARAESERIEREKRLAANPTRMTQFSAAPQAPMPSVAAQYYRGYPYAYTQAYGTQLPPSSTFTVPAAPSVPPTTPTTALPSGYATTPSTGYPYHSSGAIPVQLPVASLPALHALGIVPVPATSLPPEGQPQPPAVLRGSTSNGTMLSLEINVSLLQSAQMSGLAMVLNSLMSRSAGTTPAGSTPTPSTPAAG